MNGRSLPLLFSSASLLLLVALPRAAAKPLEPNKELKEIAPPVQLSFLETMDRTDWLLLGAAVGLLLAAGVAGWYFFLRKDPPGPPVPPDPRAVAREKLAALRQRIGQLGPREFGVEASDVLRHYIRAKYGISTMRRTSEEFLNAIVSDRTFSPREIDLLQRFLRQCDLLKFAQADTGDQEAGVLIEEATRFVDGSAPAVLRPEPLPAT